MNNTQNDHILETGPAMLDRRKFLIAGAGVVAASLLPHVTNDQYNGKQGGKHE